MQSRRATGFTLIELLVVIAIIGILLAILTPALSAARERTRTVVCQTQMRELARCGYMYANDAGKYPPCIDNYTASGLNSDDFGLDWLGIGDQFGAFNPGNPHDPRTGTPRGFAAAPRYGLLWRYYQNPDIIMCPSDFSGPYQPGQMVPPGNGKFSYTMVAMMGLRAPERIQAADHFSSENIGASDAPLFVEEHPDGVANNHREGNFGAGINPNPGSESGDTLVSRHAPYTPRFGIRPGTGSTAKFLQGVSNIGFADGHVEGIRPNFGFGRSHVEQMGNQITPNNIVGLMYRFGIKFELLEIHDD